MLPTVVGNRAISTIRKAGMAIIGSRCACPGLKIATTPMSRSTARMPASSMIPKSGNRFSEKIMLA
jgi:hypothetical protein